MDVENKLRRIYRDPADPGSLGGIDRLLRHAQELNIPGVNRRAVEEFLKSFQLIDDSLQVCGAPGHAAIGGLFLHMSPGPLGLGKHVSISFPHPCGVCFE